jgi:hypothetical protein
MFPCVGTARGSIKACINPKGPASSPVVGIVSVTHIPTLVNVRSVAIGLTNDRADKHC